jgi:superfamily II DNA/RNA helicase
MKFTELKLDEQLIEAISYMGFDTATPIQAKAIPTILENKDLIACAQTGTGKTGAFVLPIVHKLIGKEGNHVDTLIIVPTRELAIQIEQQIQGFSYFSSVGSMAIYGGGDGNDFYYQKEALVNGTDIIIATPGKLLSHLQLGYVNFSKIKHVILDEADRMLDMGFIDDLQKIFSFIPEKRQTLMFSATMPDAIRQFAKKILYKPEEISLAVSKPAEGVDQKAYLVYEEQKNDVLSYVIRERKKYTSIIIFTSTKLKVSEIVRHLNRNGLASKGISSNLTQEEREAVMICFRSKRIRILVATDLMSRGIDVKEINMVINYDVPHDAEDYVHRVGRTARVNAKGEAVTLVNPRDMYKLKSIEKLISIDVPKLQPPDELGPGPNWKDGGRASDKKKYYGKKGGGQNRKGSHHKGSNHNKGRNQGPR